MSTTSFAGALEQSLFDEYGVQVVALVRRRSVYGIVAADGERYMFKPLSSGDSEARLGALALLAPMFETANTEVALPIANRHGAHTVVIRCPDGDTTGYLQPWLTGRHVDVEVKAERESVMRALARFQRASQDSGWPAKEQMVRGTLLHKLRVKQRALEQIWPQAEIVLPELKRDREEIFARISSVIHRYSSYLIEGRDEAQRSEAFCHRDLAPHNILWGDDGAIRFIDFDHAGYDDALHDAMQFTSHCVYLGHLSQADFNVLLTTYADEAALSPSRTYLLRDLAYWPDIVIRTMIEWCRADFQLSSTHRVKYALHQDRYKRHLAEHADVTPKRLHPR